LKLSVNATHRSSKPAIFSLPEPKGGLEFVIDLARWQTMI
jgi:hypothetical protein